MTKIPDILTATLLALCPSATRAVATGALDPTFGTAGKVGVPGYGLAVQPDGKIVAQGAGTVLSTVPTVTGRFDLRRLTSTGAVDLARTDSVGSCGFCSAGIAATAGTLVQPDGKILAVGTFQTSSLNTGACKNVSFVAVRYLSTGALDSTFGGGGVASIGAGFGQGIALQADGKPVIAGSRKNYGCLSADQPDDQAVARLTAGGLPDGSFGNGGVTTTSLGGDDSATSVAVRGDGKLVVGGYAASASRDFAIAIYSAAGVLESSTLLDLGSGSTDTAYALAVQPDSKTLIGGASGANLAILRLDAAGAYDAAFGSGGKFIRPGAAIRAIVLQPDGKALAATGDGDVLRLGANGVLDAGFGLSGRISTGMANVLSMALQSDGRVVLGSTTEVARIDPAAAMPVEAAPSTLDFLGQSLNTTSMPRTATITNTSGVSQSISSVVATSGFAVTHDCATLAANASCTATVTFTPLAEGAAFGDLVVTGTAGTQKVYLLGSGERSLSTHYYNAILRRDPDAGGKAYWDGQAALMTSLGANVNETWFAMAQAFFFSAEYAALNRDDAGFVDDLYATFFNRTADPGGFAFWTGQLAGGMPREVVLAAFEFSTEFVAFTQAIFGNTGARAEVDAVMDFYRGLLSRLPDPGGFSYWVQQFRFAQCNGAATVNATVESISSQFTGGDEYLGKNRTNAQYVGDLYNAFLRRGGDLQGVQSWIGQLDATTQTRTQVRQAFMGSTEYQARVANIVNQGCLP